MRTGINLSEGTFNGLFNDFSESEQRKVFRSIPGHNFLPARVVNYMFDDPLFWMTDAVRRRTQGGPYPR